jgi:hypothetical protein
MKQYDYLSFVKKKILIQFSMKIIHINFIYPFMLRVNYHPGQEVQANSCRKTPAINRTWKHYPSRKVSGFFPMNCTHFLVFFRGKWPESHRKISKKLPTGILLPCSIDFRSFSVGFGEFLASFQKPKSSTWVQMKASMRSSSGLK